MKTKTEVAMSTKTKVAYGFVTAAVIVAAGLIVMQTTGNKAGTGAGTQGYSGGYHAPGYVPPGYVPPGYNKPGYVPPGYTKPGYKK